MDKEGVDIIIGGTTGTVEDVAGVPLESFTFLLGADLLIESKVLTDGIPKKEDARGCKRDDGEKGPEGTHL
jgi:hypothetical protein